MKTSKTIKSRQYDPIEPLSHPDDNTWLFASERDPRVRYTTTRTPSTMTFRCDCPAVGLCKHITRALLDCARPQFKVVQVWTNEQDARRQKRRALHVQANYGDAWVTFACPLPHAQRASELAALDAEIERLGAEHHNTLRLYSSINTGPRKYALRDRLQELDAELARLIRERPKVMRSAR